MRLKRSMSDLVRFCCRQSLALPKKIAAVACVAGAFEDVLAVDASSKFFLEKFVLLRLDPW